MGTFNASAADADQYQIEFAGISLSPGVGQSGWADGEVLTIEMVSQIFNDAVGTDGSWAMTKTNDRRVDIHVKTLQTSALNAALSAIVAADQQAPNGAGVGSFAVLDLQGTTLFLATRTRIMKLPAVSVDRSPKERDWWFRGIYDVFVVGGNLVNVCTGADVDAFYAGADVSCMGVMPDGDELASVMARAY